MLLFGCAGSAARAPVLWTVWADHQDLGQPAAAARARPWARPRAAGPPDRLSLRHVQAARGCVLAGAGLGCCCWTVTLLLRRPCPNNSKDVTAVGMNAGAVWRSRLHPSCLAALCPPMRPPSPCCTIAAAAPPCPDALRCIKALDSAVWKGRQVRACFGTTKYCNAFLKGVPCNNHDCLYLHELGAPRVPVLVLVLTLPVVGVQGQQSWLPLRSKPLAATCSPAACAAACTAHGYISWPD